MSDLHKWTPDDVKRITELWAEGHSASEIGATMGFTRNAIIGKSHRLQLPPRATKVRAAYDSKKGGKPKRKYGPKTPRVVVTKPVRPLPRKIAEPEPLNVSIMDLEPRQCRWIEGVGTHLHCGHSTYDGSSYCEHHYARVYEPRKPRVRHAARMAEAA